MAEEVRLVPLTKSEVAELREQIERIIYRRDDAVGTEKRALLAADANRLVAITDRYGTGISEKEGRALACGGAVPEGEPIPFDALFSGQAKLRAVFAAATTEQEQPEHG